MTITLGHRMGPLRLALCLVLTLLPLIAHAEEPVDLVVAARGESAELHSLELALIQQFAGEPVHLLLWNQTNDVRQITLELVRADLDFRPGGALLKVTTSVAERNEFVQGSDPQLLGRTIAIIISHVLSDLERPREAATATFARTAQRPSTGGSVTPPSSAESDESSFVAAKKASAPARPPLAQDEEGETSYQPPSFEAAAATKRPLHPWVSLTGFGLSAILVGPAIISANASLPPGYPPSGAVRTTDETEQVELVKVRSRSQNRLTAALVTTSVVVGTASIVLATAFTDWSGARRTSGLSVVTHPGGVGAQFFSEF